MCICSVAPAAGYNAGDQIFVGHSKNFTKLNSWGWYSWTGFVPDDIDMKLESIPVPCTLPLAPGAEFVADRIAAVKELGYNPEGHVFQLKGNFESPAEMGPFLRLAGIPDRENFDKVRVRVTVEE